MVHVHNYQNRGPHTLATYRIAWCADPAVDVKRLDFRSRRARELVAAGLAGVTYAQGIVACNTARMEAFRRAEAAAHAA